MKNPPTAATVAGAKQSNLISGDSIAHLASTSKPTKWQRVLAALVQGRSFNRFEAARELRDWCLHSTAAAIQRKGVLIERRFETIPGYQGDPTQVCRYWLAPDQIKKALALLGEAKV
ncbi:MAG: hypothetical protein ACYDB8_04230 [Acidiferrobacterales bacterium]